MSKFANEQPIENRHAPITTNEKKHQTTNENAPYTKLKKMMTKFKVKFVKLDKNEKNNLEQLEIINSQAIKEQQV